MKATSLNACKYFLQDQNKVFDQEYYPALMGVGLAWFAAQHVINRYERLRSEYSHSVHVRTKSARKPLQPGVFVTFGGPEVKGSNTALDLKSDYE